MLDIILLHITLYDAGGILQIHQHHVQRKRCKPIEPGGDRYLDVVQAEFLPTKHGIGSDLPDHEVGHFIDDVGLEARYFSRSFLAAQATIEHVDHPPVKALAQCEFESARIRNDVSL